MDVYHKVLIKLYEATGGKESKRSCDVTAKTPFAAWNLRLYRQTWHSLVGLYAPLLAASAVTVAPFQRDDGKRPRLAEICPASTLKRLGLYGSYKGRQFADERRRPMGEGRENDDRERPQEQRAHPAHSFTSCVRLSRPLGRKSRKAISKVNTMASR